MNNDQFQRVGDICRLYCEYYNTHQKKKKSTLKKQLDSLCYEWNTKHGMKCDHCGTILQIMRSGTLINCKWSRKQLGLAPCLCSR